MHAHVSQQCLQRGSQGAACSSIVRGALADLLHQHSTPGVVGAAAGAGACAVVSAHLGRRLVDATQCSHAMHEPADQRTTGHSFKLSAYREAAAGGGCVALQTTLRCTRLRHCRAGTHLACMSALQFSLVGLSWSWLLPVQAHAAGDLLAPAGCMSPPAGAAGLGADTSMAGGCRDTGTGCCAARSGRGNAGGRASGSSSSSCCPAQPVAGVSVGSSGASCGTADAWALAASTLLTAAATAAAAVADASPGSCSRAVVGSAAGGGAPPLAARLARCPPCRGRPACALLRFRGAGASCTRHAAARLAAPPSATPCPGPSGAVLLLHSIHPRQAWCEAHAMCAWHPPHARRGRRLRCRQHGTPHPLASHTTHPAAGPPTHQQCLATRPTGRLVGCPAIHDGWLVPQQVQHAREVLTRSQGPPQRALVDARPAAATAGGAARGAVQLQHLRQAGRQAGLGGRWVCQLCESRARFCGDR